MSKKAIRLTAMSAALAAAFGPALADDEISELTKPESSISVGVGNWSKDRHQQGQYDGMRDKGGYGLIDADIIKRDDASGTWMTLNTRNLGLDTRELHAEWLRQGSMGFSLDYQRIVRDNPLTFNTGLRGIGTTTMTVSGAGVNALPFGQISLGTHRDQFGLGFYRNILPGLDLNVSFKNEDKKGTRHWGRGGQPEFLVEPINATTRQLEVTLSYASKNFQISGGYYGSWYDNKYSLVDSIRNGDNPAVLGNHIYLSLPLDNEAHQLFVNSGFNFTPTTRGTLKASVTRATQNERMPTIDIAGLSDAAAPSNLHGKIVTTQVQLGLTSRPIKNLSIVANLNYHNAKDETPTVRVITTNAACAVAGQCVDNTPFSFKTITGKLEASYALPMQFRLIGGIDEKRQDRNIPVGTVVGGVDTQRYVPFREKQDETTYRLQLRRAMSETINGSIAYLHSKRDGSALTLTEEFPSDLINPINIADRKRDRWRASVDWAATEQLSFQANLEDAKDDYKLPSDRPYGVRDGKASLFSLDATYAMGEDWNVSAWYSYDRNRSNQYAARWNRTSLRYELDKEYRMNDTGDAVGVSLRGKISSKIKIGADVQWSKNKSESQDNVTTTGIGATVTPTTNPPVNPAGAIDQTRGTVQVPTSETKFTRLSFYLEYALRKNADLRFDLIHERWRTNDWTWFFADGSPFVYNGSTTAAPTDQTVVSYNPNQSSTFVGLRYIYKFQ